MIPDATPPAMTPTGETYRTREREAFAHLYGLLVECACISPETERALVAWGDAYADVRVYNFRRPPVVR